MVKLATDNGIEKQALHENNYPPMLVQIMVITFIGR